MTSYYFMIPHTDIKSILNDFNSIHPNLTFTDELEQDNKLNFLDITIHKNPRGHPILYIQKAYLH